MISPSTIKNPARMSNNDIRCISVWPPLLRLSHWLMAAGVSFQLISAWIVANTTSDLAFWQDYHLMVGQLLILVVLFRGWLLFQQGVGNWRNFKTSKAQLEGAGQMMKFYMSLFRFPLPSWFAYNPLWQMVYPAMLLFVLLAVITGVLHSSSMHLLGASMSEVHATVTTVLYVLVLLHVATAILQDWKGKGGSTSAMLNGRRYFHVDTEQAAQQVGGSGGVEVHIPASSIKKKPSEWKDS